MKNKKTGYEITNFFSGTVRALINPTEEKQDHTTAKLRQITFAKAGADSIILLIIAASKIGKTQ